MISSCIAGSSRLGWGVARKVLLCGRIQRSFLQLKLKLSYHSVKEQNSPEEQAPKQTHAHTETCVYTYTGIVHFGMQTQGHMCTEIHIL